MKMSIAFTVTRLGIVPIAKAQIAPAPGSASLTLAETLAFLNSTFAEQGSIPLGPKGSTSHMVGQHIVTVSDCAWRYQYQLESSQPLLGDGSVTVDLPLSKLDAKTMALSTRAGALTVYDVTVEKPADEKTADSDAPTPIGTLKDRDTAERVAKAYVHALVLCRKRSAF